MTRLGWITRVIQEHHISPLASSPYHKPQRHEVFWGDLRDPMTLALAAEHTQGAMIDCSTLPTHLWSTQAPAPPKSPQTERSWRGGQEWMGHVVLGALGRRGASYETPTRHSTWREDKASSSSLSARSPLREALSIPPLTPLSQSRPLTLIIPSAQLSDFYIDLLCKEALDAYVRASWSPQILCFDWTLGDALSALERPPSPGELDLFISELLMKLLALKQRSSHLISELLKDRISGLNQLPLSLIGIEDLVSASLLIHQKGQTLTSYWARGDRLTWGSLTQMCLYLIDELDPIAAEQAHQALSHKLKESVNHTGGSWRTQIARFLRSLAHTQRSQVDSLLGELKQLASRIRGGAAPQHLTSQLAPLPQHFNWTPAHTLLEDQVRSLLQAHHSPPSAEK